MTSFPGSPRIIKGALIGIDAFNPLASVVVFQYNLNTLRSTRYRCINENDILRRKN